MAALEAFGKSRMVLLQAEPERMFVPDEDKKPNFAPSYTVHISPSAGGESNNAAGDGFRNFQHFTLKDLIAELYNTTRGRVLLPASLDEKQHYDIAIVVPDQEGNEVINNRIRQGIEDYFHVTVTREDRLVDTYVVTTVDGTPPKSKFQRSNDPDSDSGAVWGSSSSVEFRVLEGPGDPDALLEEPRAVSLDAIAGIFMEGTADEFCHTLEETLDRPVINESRLQGDFAFNLKASDGPENDFLQRLRDELHISITPAQRRVQIVALKAR